MSTVLIGMSDVPGAAWISSLAGPGRWANTLAAGFVRTLSVHVRDFTRLEPLGVRTYDGQARS
jgi:hypothetical protein